MEELLASMGIQAVGFVFLAFVLKQMFKNQEQYQADIAKLCGKIDELVTIINMSQLSDLDFKNKLSSVLDRSEKDYLKIHSLIDSQNDKIDKIHLLCEKINHDNKKMPVERILVSKGYITEEQLAEALLEQQKMLS